MASLTWQEFLTQSRQFLRMSQHLNDKWELYEKNQEEPNIFLKFSQKVRSKEDLINVEYHIVYSVSYQVPMLYFQAHRSDGSLLDLEATWRLLMLEFQSRREELLQMLTQQEHPVLFRPFMALHPCRTAEVLDQFGQKSENLVLTFISLYGPHVQLQLSNGYGNSELLKL
ncbi:uncharacterized protein Dwil_GK21969 [Drosophila willistoni]|uniref:ubiquitin-like-conjugating enzyme ATG10 n=1 Tax=Drosophila willistoni TaxID=7260 RepID=UPI000732788F|nr:ubiquitin-like-conjugating enzyme ATG10 [Drosophila willistoni]EDW74531.2 uncharacterized protein Dwil_GK21969 [Drosophila willistoni]